MIRSGSAVDPKCNRTTNAAFPLLQTAGVQPPSVSRTATDSAYKQNEARRNSSLSPGMPHQQPHPVRGLLHGQVQYAPSPPQHVASTPRAGRAHLFADAQPPSRTLRSLRNKRSGLSSGRPPCKGVRHHDTTSACTSVPVINLPGSSLEYPRYSQEYLNHVTFAPPRGGRPDGAGWLPRRVRTDGRVKLSGTRVRAGYEPCTFEQQALFEDHSQHTFGRWRRPARDGQSGLPSTTLDYVSATELSPT